MIERTIKSKVLNSIKTRPVALITGARQVGKSTLCRELMNLMPFSYVTLDNLRERETAVKDPEFFLSIHHWPLIIDDVQYAPGLFQVIEAVVNEEKFNGRSNYGMFVLTGSQSYRLMEGVSESLAGRVSIISMSPLSMSEINGAVEEPFIVDLSKAQARTAAYHISSDSMFEHIVRGFYHSRQSTTTEPCISCG
jgi:predicted AAA+ superfamily ATPase